MEAWAETLLRPYVARLEVRPPSTSPKEFNDPVWGTIVLRALEVVLLDSPLLQRLRYVRQLGVVHLVYPAAHHTRLEHTIGVVAQADRLVESINEHFAEEGPIDLDKRNLLRLAALCHDVGHGLMSHVSENALDNFEEVQELRTAFSDEVEGEDIKLGEIASYYVIGSPVFADLVTAAKTVVDERHLPLNAIELVQRVIIGQPIDDRIPLLHELISGPFDADKLDYMTRDAFMTGVPVVTDIARLVQKIRALDVPQQKLPEKVKKIVPADGESHYVMTGISLSGGRTLDELMFGRVLLHDKLYRHHKVRAAEAMIASIFRQVAMLAPEGPALFPFKLVDHEILELSVAKLEQIAGRALNGSELQAAEVAVALAANVRARELFIRAFAFAQDMPSDPYHSDPLHYDGLEEVVRNSDDFEFRGELIGHIADELRAICELLDPGLIEQFGDNFKPYLWLDPPLAPPDNTDVLHAYLISEGPERDILDFKAGIAGASRWSDAYLLTRDTGYIFTAPELATYTFVASEVVFRERFGIRTPASMHTYAKLEMANVIKCKRDLDAKNYYQGRSTDLWPMPTRLSKADIQDRITNVLERLRGYEGPRTTRSDKGPPLLRRERVLDWLKQFGADFEDEPLRLLEDLRMVGREQVIAALHEFLGVHGDHFEGAAVCPLGTAKDSSAITTYYANDLRGVNGIEVLALSEALTMDRPIIFIDDFIGSGQQSVSILEAWFDAERTTELGEARDVPLSESAQQGLRDRNLAFVFAAGQHDGVGRLDERVTSLELTGRVFLAGDHHSPRAFSGPLSPLRSQLEERCRQVGLALLDDGNEKHDEAWRDRRALGYGNEAFLVTFPYNTPTQTLTCLWKGGEVEGVEWTALLPRRPKL